MSCARHAVTPQPSQVRKQPPDASLQRVLSLKQAKTVALSCSLWFVVWSLQSESRSHVGPDDEREARAHQICVCWDGLRLLSEETVATTTPSRPAPAAMPPVIVAKSARPPIGRPSRDRRRTSPFASSSRPSAPCTRTRRTHRPTTPMAKTALCWAC